MQFLGAFGQGIEFGNFINYMLDTKPFFPYEVTIDFPSQ